MKRLDTARMTLAALVLASAFLPHLISRSLARQATPAVSPIAVSDGPLPPPWLQLGPDGILFARTIVDGPCPSLGLDGIPSPMVQRAESTADFPVLACEAVIPFGATEAEIDGSALPLPAGRFERIAVIGDAGCRLDDWEKKYQACNDPTAWPFAQVAQSVAAWQPDLVVHVGDFLYREAACPAGNAGCAGSPSGDNWETWNADFFAPVSPLLGAAPWVFMRGNHEMCGRNPEGWFRYLDPRLYSADCQRYTDPYVVPMIALTLAVIDSAEASDTSDPPAEVAAYRDQFAALAEMAPPGSWLVTHRPMWGILEGKTGEIEVDNASYQAATGGALGADYGLILSGHIHLAESLAFDPASGRPPQLISGNAGTSLDSVPTASSPTGQLGDPTVEEAETLSSFGFLTLEPDGPSWIATQRNAAGEPILSCELALPEITCAGAGAQS